MSFDNQIVQLDVNTLDQMFEGNVKVTETEKPLIQTTNVGDGLDSIPDLDDLETKETDETDGKETTETKTPEELLKEKEDKEKLELEATAAKEKEEKEKLDKEAEAKKDTPEIKEALKNTVDYLVKSGVWSEFEGREDLEITEEVYAELATKQNQHLAYEIVNELIDSTGSYGKAIITHIKNGGNPDEIIDIFKEQKEVKQIDTKDEAGKQTLIEKYYSEVLGWKPEKVQKTIKRLVENNEIESEFTDTKELYDKHYEERLKETQKATEEHNKAVAKKQEEFKASIKQVLDTDDSLSAKDKAVIQSSILDFKHKLENGQKVNDFYLKFAEMQSDPKQYIKLVRFVVDNEGYEKQLRTKEETKANVKAFSFIKGNKALDKVKTSPTEVTDKTSKEYKGTNFSFALKNK